MSRNQQATDWMPSSVLVADDHPFVREYVSNVCRGKWRDARIHHAKDFDETITSIKDGEIDFLIIDYSMPSMCGRDAIEAILQRRPALKTIIFSGAVSSIDAAKLLRAGVAAYIPKAAGAGTLENVIDLVLMGETYAPTTVIADLMRSRLQLSTVCNKGDEPAIDLSERELTLLTEMAKGMSNKLIAGVLGGSESMVKQVARALFRKLGVRTRAQAVVAGLQLGLVSLEEDRADILASSAHAAGDPIPQIKGSA